MYTYYNDIAINFTLSFTGHRFAPGNLSFYQNNTVISNNNITVRFYWSPLLNNDGNISYQVTVENATEVMYSDETMAFVTLNSSGQYIVHITALNFAGSSPALSGVINIINTGSYCTHLLLGVNAYSSMWVFDKDF